MVGPRVLLAVGAVAAAIAILFVPLPWVGIHDYTATVQTTISETCVIACSYSVQAVNPGVTGTATVWTGIVAWADPSALGIAGPCLDCQYKVTATLSNGQSASIGETKFVSNLLNFGYTDTLTLGFAFVPAGSYGVTVTVTLNGGTIATGSSTLCAGC